MRIRTFLIADVPICVRVDDDTIFECLLPLIQHYPETLREARLTYSILGTPATQLDRDGYCIGRRDDPLDIPPLFEKDVLGRAIFFATGHWKLHACAFAKHDRCCILVGSSGNGKTTTALAMLNAGFTLLSDECVILQPDFTVTGIPRPLIVNHETAVKRLPGPTIPYPMHADDLKKAPSQVIMLPSDKWQHDPCKATLVISLYHTPNEETAFTPQSAGEMLARMGECSLEHPPNNPMGCLSWLAKVKTGRLKTKDIPSAVATILAEWPP